MQTIEPGSIFLFCKPDEAETKTKSGLLLTDQAAAKPKTAQVINVGTDVKGYRAKDTIVYKSYATTDIKLNGEDYLLLSQEDVLGKVVTTKK